jgi:DNA-binding IclR family transcriptional regulator
MPSSTSSSFSRRGPGIKPSPSARRAAQVLTFLAGNTEQAFTVSELARALDMNRATCQSVLMALDEDGFVRRDPKTKGYCLGPALIPLGEAALTGLRVVDEASPEVERLATDTGVECIASVANGAEMIVVARAGPSDRFGGFIRVGQTIPICPPFGIAFVAWADDAAIDTWLARAGKLPDAERKRYLASIDAVRTRGYSVTLEIRSRERLAPVLAQLRSRRHRADADGGAAEHQLINQLLHEEYLLPEGEEPASHRLAQLSVPVFGPDRQVALVIGLSGFPHDLTAEEIDAYVAPLVAAADRITDRLHGMAPSIS